MRQAKPFQDLYEVVGPWAKSDRAALHHADGFGRQKARQAHDPDAEIPFCRQRPAQTDGEAEAEFNIAFQQVHAVELDRDLVGHTEAAEFGFKQRPRLRLKSEEHQRMAGDIFQGGWRPLDECMVGGRN